MGLLDGKIAAVTGATSGSGRAIAVRFAEEGATVVLLARGEDRLNALVSEMGGPAVGIRTDIGDADSVRTAFGSIHDRFGKLDILINNAAVYRPCPVEQLSDSDILTQVHTNFIGPVYTSRAAIPLLKAAGGGDIVNTSSESTLEPFPLLSIYVSTKAALEAFSGVLRSEVEKDGIRVTTLVQGAAIGEGGGSTGWAWDPQHAEAALKLWEEGGWLSRASPLGQTVEHIADVHVYLVTRPRGQKLEVIHVRSYAPPQT
jgi:meso-butanediol dehydrogenase / (S,S)-butanediol dehydrogenase / diacetyl reductase